MRDKLLALALMGVLIIPAAGFAQSATDKLIQGIQAHNELEWTKAVADLNEALQLGLPQASQVEAYKYLGFSYLNTDNLDAAKNAFENLLRIDPAYELDATLPPKYLSFFELVKSGFKSGGITPKRELGAISVKSEPSSAQVALDGVLQKGRTPTQIENVAAGKHVLTLTLDGYSDWKREISVESGKTADVDAKLAKAMSDPPPPKPDTPAKKKSSLKKWLVIGGGVIAAGIGIVMALLSGGDDDDDDNDESYDEEF